jgi:hypothetical protein
LLSRPVHALKKQPTDFRQSIVRWDGIKDGNSLECSENDTAEAGRSRLVFTLFR